MRNIAAASGRLEREVSDLIYDNFLSRILNTETLQKIICHGNDRYKWVWDCRHLDLGLGYDWRYLAFQAAALIWKGRLPIESRHGFLIRHPDADARPKLIMTCGNSEEADVFQEMANANRWSGVYPGIGSNRGYAGAYPPADDPYYKLVHPRPCFGSSTELLPTVSVV